VNIIWIPIFLALGLFAILSFLPDNIFQTRDNEYVFNKIEYIFFAIELQLATYFMFIFNNEKISNMISIVCLFGLVFSVQSTLGLNKSYFNKFSDIDISLTIKYGFSFFIGWLISLCMMTVVNSLQYFNL
jgi:hypothetical protein